MRRHQRYSARLKLVPYAAVLSVVATLLSTAGAVADTPPPGLWSPGPLPAQPSVAVTDVTGETGPAQEPAALRAAEHAKQPTRSAPAPVVWPAAAAADVQLVQSATAPTATSPRTLRATTGGPVTAPRRSVTTLVHAGGTPVWVGPALSLDGKLLPPTAAARAARTADSLAATPQAVHAAVASHAAAQRAGVDGLLVSLSRTDTSRSAERVAVALDYSGIRDAFGAGYGERLHLVSYPACVLTTPQVASCQVATPVAASANDTAHHRLVADVSLPATAAPTAVPDAAGTATTGAAATGTTTTGAASTGTVTAADAVVLASVPDASGSSGSFKASPLSSSSKWGTSGATGAFTYSYPIAVPPALGGEAPALALSYDSQSADGRTSQTNNQGSWAGDAWTLWPGSVNRSYRTCSDDGEAKANQEQCWAGDNASITLNGASHELVPTSTAGTFRFADDDGSTVKELTGAANGLNGGTYWQVTDRSGTVYVFGADHLPTAQGGTGSDTSTNSAWGAPVFGNNTGEPCHGSTLDASWCTQGWQWNLDFTVDAHKNITVYHYATESNYYGRGSTHTPTAYTRGGSLTSVTYGQHTADYTAGHNPAAKVTFALAAEGRCDPTGGFTCSGATLGTANASHWPDVPYDQNCGSSTCANHAPTFWTNDRLTGITTQVWDTGLSTPGYRTADTYTLKNQDFPDPADGTTGTGAHAPTPKAMWLDSITHTGADTGAGGAAVTENPVTFKGAFLPNRVPGLIEPAVVPLNRQRITSITTETGSTIAVSYQNDTCSRTTPPSEDNDHTTCYPVRWAPDGYDNPILDWFNKYLVGEVDVSDNKFTQSPSQVTRYDYSQGTPAWHHNDDEITLAKYRTWDQWRGYSQVITRTGAGSDPVGKSISWYLQGMDGDLNADGTHKSATVTPTRGGTITDRDQWAGQAYQTTTYDHDGGYARSRTVTIPWISPATATHTRGGGLPDESSYYTDTAATYDMTWISGSTWRTTGIFTAYDDTTGLALSDDDRGEIDASDQPVSGTTTPEKCSRTSYATTSSGETTGLTAEVVDIAGSCTQAADSTHTLSDTRTYYDNSITLGQVPGAGDPTAVTSLKDFSGAGGAATWTAPAKTGYDTYGRITSTTDALGHSTSTAYLPANSIALPTSTVLTNPKGWTTTATLDVARSLNLSTSDVNKHVTSYVYDGLGRLTKGWSPAHTQAANPTTPLVQFTYNVSATNPSWVEEQDLREDLTYKPTYTIYDSLLQAREEQTVTADDTSGARLISATFYDSHGQVTHADASFPNPDADPSSTFVLPVDAQVPDETVTAYDGMGRVTSATQEYDSVPQNTTTTTYPTGDETDVSPPAGATPTATITDARGQTAEFRQFHGTAPTGTFDATRYGYDAAGRQTTLTDSSGNTWTTWFDQLGDKIKSSDPDTGTTTYGYDDNKNLTETTDARHTPSGGVTTSYDNLGRATDTYAVPAAGGTPVHLTHTGYDPTGSLGQIAATTSYDSSGRAWTSTVAGYTPDDLPTGTTTTVPAGGVNNTAAISYTASTTYKPITRNTEATTLPAVGPMAQEKVNYAYDDNGLTVTMGGKNAYLSWMEYTHLGQPLRAHMGVTPTEIDETYNWEASTGRLLNTALDMQSGATPVDRTAYTYNPAGGLTSVSDAQDAGGTAKTDTQCFAYDYLQRLTQAWTDTGGTTTAPAPSIQGQGGCTHTAPQAANLGGPDPYWQSFGYDATGNRTSETDHSTTGDTGQDATTTQTYPAPGTAHPHGVSTATTGNGGGKQTFTYDDSGDTTDVARDIGNKVLASGASLNSGASLTSNGARLTMQTDGNLVLYAVTSGQALWSSNTPGNPGATATMGTDGNLTVHTATGTTLWAAGSSGAGAYAKVQDDGDLAVTATGGAVLWHSNTASVDRAASDTKLTYDDDGHLATVTQSGTGGTSTTSYVYDAGGALLARTDNGTSTLFLGADEVTVNAAGTISGDTRSYAADGAPVAVRTASTGSTATTLHFQAADPHGTATTDITADNTSVTRRAYTPFGQDRTTGGNPTTWPGDKGFVGGTIDTTTGLTNLGAREYDPALGRFLSADPLLDAGQPQQWNGYSYSNGDPVNLSDPAGTRPEGACDGPCNDGRIETWSGGNDDGWQYTVQSRPNKHHRATIQHVDFRDASKSWVATVKIKEKPKPKKRSFLGKIKHAAVSGIEKGAKFAYKASGLSDVVGCITAPSLGGCAQAALMVAAFAVTGGEDELEIAAYKAGEDIGADAAADAAADEGVSAAEDAAGCATHSFTATTQVLEADGHTVAIKDVKVGDKVQATDPVTGKTSPHTVQHLIKTTTDHDFTNLTITPGKPAPATTGHPAAKPATTAKPATLTTTWHHPFWDTTHHRWTNAHDLTPGTHLRQLDGSTATVTAIRNYHTTATTYDLTITDLHTYYVLAGSTPVLVHNCAAGGRTKGLRPDPDAEGPHVTFRRDASTGKVSHYAEWTEQTNSRNPAPWEQVKRVDMQGVPHYDKVTGDSIPTPHVNLPDGSARPTEPWEKTQGY